MKRHIYGIGFALLTLVIGIAISSKWIVRHISQPAEQAVLSPTRPLNPANINLPCAESQLNIKEVKELLALGVDVDSTGDSCINMKPSPRGVTLLMKSARAGDKEMVKLLLENGANVNAMDSWEDTPLTYAISGNAISGKNLEIIGLLIKKGADVNVRGEYDRTPLMEAAATGDLEAIKYLLDNGADINARDNNKVPALLYAASEKHAEAMRLLIERGANPNVKDKNGRNAGVYLKNGFPSEYIISRN